MTCACIDHRILQAGVAFSWLVSLASLVLLLYLLHRDARPEVVAVESATSPALVP